jgi:hypothetical protein
MYTVLFAQCLLCLFQLCICPFSKVFPSPALISLLDYSHVRFHVLVWHGTGHRSFTQVINISNVSDVFICMYVTYLLVTVQTCQCLKNCIVIRKLQPRKIWNVFLFLYPVSFCKCQLLLKNQLKESLAPRVRCVRWCARKPLFVHRVHV